MKMIKILVAVATLFGFGCQKKQDAEIDTEKYTIVCTTGMIADVVRNVAGSQANVLGLIGEGVDPHLYKPTMRDTKLLLSADLIFFNGLHLEGKMGEILDKMKTNGKPTYAVAEAVIEQGELLHDEEGGHDPHVWMDVQLWERVVGEVKKCLIGFDSESAELFESNFQSYQTKLAELDRYAKQVISSIPEGKKQLVTAHDAFGYMSTAYGLSVRGIQGISTESEAGLKDLEQLVSFLVEKSIPAVFVESSVSDKNVRALVEGAKARDHDVIIGGELFSDAMGQPGTYEGTYLGMIDHNVTTIARALGGEAPEQGMAGQLKSH